MRIGPAAVVLLLAIGCAAAAAPADDNALQCAALKNQGVTMEQKIAACTALIEGGQAQGEDLGVLYARRGDGNYFLAKYDAAVSDYNAAMTFFGKGGLLTPKMSDLVDARGYAYDDGNRFARAIADFNRVLAANPDRASARFGRARALGLLGYSFHSREDLDKAIALQPNRIENYIARSAAWLTTGDVPHAIQDLDYALLLAPNNAGAYYNRGLAYYAAGQFDLSIHDFEQALSLTPGDPFPGEITRDQLNRALKRTHEVNDAWNANAAVVAATPPPPRDAAPGTVSPSRAVGRTHDCSSRYPDISRMLWEAGDVQVSYDVDDKGAISNVTLVRTSGSERLDRAALSCVSMLWRNTPASRDGVPIASPGHQAIVRFSISSEPSSGDDFVQQGRGLACIGAFDRAMAAFGRAVQLSPKSAPAHYQRGFLEYLLGRSDQAIADFDIALTLKPGDRDTIDARDLARAEQLHPVQGHAI
jgi:TonB family protein